MNKAELLEALQRQTKLRPTHVKRVVDAIFDPVDGVISRQIKRGGKVTIAGFGTFDPVYRRFEPDYLLSTIYLNEAHNEPMQLLIEGGLGALLLLAAFLAWWAFAAVRAVRPRRAAPRRAMGMAMATATLILMLSSLVDYPLRTPLLSSLFAIACVELIKSRRRSIPPSTT